MTSLCVVSAPATARRRPWLLTAAGPAIAQHRPASARSTRSKPADSKQDTNLKPHPTPPTVTALDKIPVDKIKLPAGFKAEVWSHGHPGGAHHGDGRQGHHLHGHAA